MLFMYETTVNKQGPLKITKEVPAEGCPGKIGNGRSYATSFLPKLLLVYLYEATVLPVTSTKPNLHYTYTHWGL